MVFQCNALIHLVAQNATFSEDDIDIEVDILIAYRHVLSKDNVFKL